MIADQQHKERRCPTCGRDDFESDQAYAGHRSRHSNRAYHFTPEDGRKGAIKLNQLPVPECCPKCGRRRFKNRAAFNSHMGLHGLSRALGYGDSRSALKQAARALAEIW